MQQAITWANVDEVLGHHMASLGHDELMKSIWKVGCLLLIINDIWIYSVIIFIICTEGIMSYKLQMIMMNPPSLPFGWSCLNTWYGNVLFLTWSTITLHLIQCCTVWQWLMRNKIAEWCIYMSVNYAISCTEFFSAPSHYLQQCWQCVN